MKNLFSIGELSKLQNISKQTLIYYDKIGLFPPAYTNPQTGYRYYSAAQLDYLDTICIMKKIGFSLEEIKQHMNNYTIDYSIVALRKQLNTIDKEINELQMIKSRVEHRCTQLENAISIRDYGSQVTIEFVKSQTLYLQQVKNPSPLEISIATKECFGRAFKEHLPVFFQSGAIVPYQNILQNRYTEASYVFLPIETGSHNKDILELPEGKCICTYHIGDYNSIGYSYKRLLAYCSQHQLTIISDAYEFAINDYLSTKDENEYITKILFYIQ